MRFDPEKVDRLKILKAKDGTVCTVKHENGDIVRYSDYVKLLEVYRGIIKAVHAASPAPKTDPIHDVEEFVASIKTRINNHLRGK